MSMPFEGRWLFDHEEHEHTYSNYQKQTKHKRKTGKDYICVGCKDKAREYAQKYRTETKHSADHKYAHRKTKADHILRKRHWKEWQAIMHLLAEGEDPE